MSTSAPPPQNARRPPVIPESWLTIQEQRLYVVGFFGLMQAYKLSDVFFYLYQSTLSSSPRPPPSTFLSPLALLNHIPGSSFILPPAEASSSAYLVKWLLWDSAIILIIPRLRIPNFWYGTGRTVLYISLLSLLDFFLLGKFHVWASVMQLLAVLWQFITNPFGKIRTLSENMSSVVDVLNSEKHLLGSLTIDIKPAGHAQINPLSATYCLPPSSSEPVYIPILTNNSAPEVIVYRIRSYDVSGGIVSSDHTIPASKLKKHLKTDVVRDADIFSAEDDEDALDFDLKGSTATAKSGSMILSGLADGFDPMSAVVVGGASGSLAHKPSIRPGETLKSIPRQLESTEQVWYLAIDKPGVVDIVKIQDEDGYPFRLKRTSGTVIIECPGEVQMLDVVETGRTKKGGNGESIKRCVGDEDVVGMTIKGVGALQVGWRIVEMGGTKAVEEQTLPGIEVPETTRSADPAGNTEQQLITKDDQWVRPAAFSQARSHNVHLPVVHSRSGIYDVQLHTVTDSLGNVFHPLISSSHRTFEVHSRPSVHFSTACSSPTPLRLLEGQSVQLPIQVEKDNNDVKVNLRLSYRPIDSGVGAPWTKNIEVDRKTLTYPVNQPGIYVIDEINGQVCPGTVKEPSSCIVKAVPKPSARVATKAIQECGIDVGIQATLDMTGTPPFAVSYSVIRKGEKKPKVEYQTFPLISGQINLVPKQEGEYEYKFTEIQDANYKGVPISSPSYHQVVHPVAQVQVKGNPKDRRKLYTCAAGNSTSIDVAVSGTAPILISYNVAWPGSSRTFSKEFERSGSYVLPIEIPEAVRNEVAGGGGFSVVVHTIKDGNGCEKHVESASALFDVQTAKPTLRFGTVNDQKAISLIEGKSAQVPVRITGEGPWSVKYRVNSGKEQSARLTTHNAYLSVDRGGRYELLQVQDRHCTGLIVEEDSFFDVSILPRPSIKLASDTVLSKSREIERVCAGVEGQVTLKMTGQSPFDVRYTHIRKPLEGYRGKAESSEKTLRSAQDSGVLHLASTPGHHSYEISGIGDSAYSLPAQGKAALPIISFEQTVYARPRATFKNLGRPSYCLDEPFLRKADHAPRIVFEGEPPFSVNLLVTQPGHRKPSVHSVVGIKTKEWPLEIPDYIFNAVGQHTVTLQNVRDSSECAFESLEDDVMMIGVDVVEPASIVSVDRKEHHCVGDVLEFVLQGTAPWTISYSWNGKVQHVSTQSPKFTRLAEKAGRFEIQTVAHQRNQCLAKVTDLARTIHPIPAARVSEGNAQYESIHEGGEAEIVFSLQGTPPFTFTYTRSTPSGKKGHFQVVETQTVSNLMESTYSIFSSEAGAYHVSYIADAYCSYPPILNASPDDATRLITNG